MNHTLQPTGGILVIANRTCPCPTLVDEVALVPGRTTHPQGQSNWLDAG